MRAPRAPRGLRFRTVHDRSHRTVPRNKLTDYPDCRRATKRATPGPRAQGRIKSGKRYIVCDPGTNARASSFSFPSFFCPPLRSFPSTDPPAVRPSGRPGVVIIEMAILTAAAAAGGPGAPGREMSPGAKRAKPTCNNNFRKSSRRICRVFVDTSLGYPTCCVVAARRQRHR